MKRTLFLLAAVSAISHGAVGDNITIDDKHPYFIDGVQDTVPTNINIQSVDLEFSTRFYDSNKGGPWTVSYSDGTEGDSLMCWSHAATNAIQYWQDVYGVFYKDSGNMQATNTDTARELPNGKTGTEPAWFNAPISVPNSRQLLIAKTFYENWGNQGGKFRDAVDWYFRYDATTANKPGGYYSEYFGNYNTGTVAYVSTEITNNLGTLKNALLDGLGLESLADGTYTQKEEGLLAGISITRDVGEYTYGHAINCIGLTLDDSGNLVSMLITNGDDGISQLEQVYLKSDANDSGKIKLYRDKACTTLWQRDTEWYVTDVSYISTPQVLKDMLAEYRSADEAAIWNGAAKEWTTQEDIVDSEIADSSTGWDILVNGDNIDEQHHDYYHSYATDGRKVEFGAHAAENARTVTINGTVSSQEIAITAAGYRFEAGEKAAIAPGADMTLSQGGTLHSELALQLKKLSMEGGTLLSSDSPIVVTGEFHTLKSIQEAATFSIQAAATAEEAEIVRLEADLDLRVADEITLEVSVDLAGHNLYLNEETPITLALDTTGESYVFFSGIKELYIGDTKISGSHVVLNDYLNITTPEAQDGYTLLFNNGSITMSIPEPATASLSLLALMALAARRRRTR